MAQNYCYWSVATGDYGAMFENCVRSARASGVFKEFHVLTDRCLKGCECYDAMECDKGNGLFKLQYLKVGMSRLAFEYFIWIDADSIFVRNPENITAALGCSPIHVPLEGNLDKATEECQWKGLSCKLLRQLLLEGGVSNRAYFSRSAFWIVHREAIDLVFELAFQFFNTANKNGHILQIDAALGYAMQMLCGDPERHGISENPELWATWDGAEIPQTTPQNSSWEYRSPIEGTIITVCPAIMHLPRLKSLLTT